MTFMSTTTDLPAPPLQSPRRTRNRWLIALAMVFGAVLVVLGITVEYVVRHAGPILRSSVVADLSRRFHSPVELDSLDISVAKGLQVHGHGLRILYLAGPTQPDLAQKQGLPVTPMLSVNDFSFRTTFSELLHLRANIASVYIDGMELHIPPRDGHHILGNPAKSRIAINVATIFCKNVNLVIENSNPQKEPLHFAIQQLKLTDVGGGQAMLYTADLINPIPTGAIHASGHFGPWQSDDPRGTPIDGHYVFSHADLHTIKGIGGTLDSTGDFEGRLSHLTVDGTTTTPNFSLDISGHPLPLTTTFHAFVDGTNGDTTLDPVEAVLNRSHITARGVVNNIHGKGHDIALTVDIPSGRIEDLLQLTMKTEPPAMRGAVELKGKLHIGPGDVRVIKKMELAGTFHINDVEFTSTRLQDRIDGLSMRAQGKPKDAKAAETDNKPEVASQMNVNFDISHGLVTVNSLDYQIPGAQINLHGAEELDSNIFEFKGHVRTDATASQMVTGWKSTLLKPFDGMFSKSGAGLQLPIQITGSHGDFKLGFALHGADDSIAQIKADLHNPH
jgi:hypothetical protein